MANKKEYNSADVCKGMKQQIAHWPVGELLRTMSANRTTAQDPSCRANAKQVVLEYE